MGSESPNVLSILWDALWGFVTGTLGIVGIQPDQAIYALGVLGGVFVIYAAIQSARTVRTEPGVVRFVTGPLGSGKSAYASRLIGKALLAGKPVVSNVKLVDDWPDRVSRRFWSYRFRPTTRREHARKLRGYYLYVPEISDLIDVRAACHICKLDPLDCRHRPREGRALMVIDEVDNEINNREYMKDHQKEFLRKLRMARKRGFVVYLISQHAENVDKAARRIMLENVRLVNWQQLLRVPFVGAPLLPFPLFTASRYRNEEAMSAAMARKERRMGREFFRINWTSHLYDTFQDYSDETAGVVASAPLIPVIEGRVVPGSIAGGASVPSLASSSDRPS